MHYPIAIPTRYQKFRAQFYRLVKWPCLAMCLCGYLFIALIVMLYLSMAPVYQSDLELVLPGTGASSSVVLDNVGQVVSQTSAPFSAGGFNPRVNYKEMLLSRGVLNLASEKTSLSAIEFGEPKIALTEQTSILVVSIKGSSAKQAETKAWALYQSLQEELSRLRSDEVSHRDKSIQRVLADYRVRLNEARANILQFQQDSSLVSQDQFTLLVSSLQTIKEKQLYLHAEVSNLIDYAFGLGKNLGVSADLAGKAFTLQSDVEFRGLLKELDISTSQLSEYQSRWGNGHPKVIAEHQRYQAARSSLLIRSNTIAGPHAASVFSSLDLEVNPMRAQMFADLIDASAKEKGITAQIADLRRSELHLQDQLKIYAREAAVLDRLQREFDLAEAVFTSAAARLEAGKADVFASYPVLQLLTKPSLPTDIHSPILKLGLAAGLVGFLFITSGVTVLCNRRRIIKVLLKRS
ncbi:GumC family protein [Paraglaciecola psychrophila]|uniref:Polysaccharide chain length determinant N-terminal domain-containing protein n=1 Tax=Paraglaciecola psychrophila 170 TaxID=1129794 RepID=K7A9L5_9ALTE|nr:hypothetical protein [Paraglaciecola psychrophila]AGH45672.1 hypothetical protein C427_3564 [Paraglaciecola psychrophila 170]GAC37418.1 hypothetical protein GPSY_1789 [Paraglaciecola psychrophila 170]